MNDVMITIRMPSSLVSELKELAKSEHFLDLSEEVRSIVRSKWIESSNPELFELKKLREDVTEEVKKKSMRKVYDEIGKELQKIKEQIQKEGLDR